MWMQNIIVTIEKYIYIYIYVCIIIIAYMTVSEDNTISFIIISFGLLKRRRRHLIFFLFGFM
jgi:hypothetical protein